MEKIQNKKLERYSDMECRRREDISTAQAGSPVSHCQADTSGFGNGILSQVHYQPHSLTVDKE
ncbi:hypothetical protein DRN97_02355 [Methanosarcinales archaeon]|nr:MAG: hypothetical protein DRN97_02355 [Methanosarcinales archaeon]